MTTDIYIWVCHEGHKSAHSEAEMLSSIVEPRCGRALADGGRCRANLKTKLRPYPEPLDGPVIGNDDA